VAKQKPLYTATVNANWYNHYGKQYGDSSKTRDRSATLSSDTAHVHIPKECKTRYSRDICTLMFIAALFTIGKLWKQPKCPTSDAWIMNFLYIYTMEYYSATRNNAMGFEDRRMQLEYIMLSEVS
jgi:hypothetical protein